MQPLAVPPLKPYSPSRLQNVVLVKLCPSKPASYKQMQTSIWAYTFSLSHSDLNLKV